jgi:hypothetical protein
MREVQLRRKWASRDRRSSTARDQILGIASADSVKVVRQSITYDCMELSDKEFQATPGHRTREGSRLKIPHQRQL